MLSALFSLSLCPFILYLYFVCTFPAILNQITMSIFSSIKCSLSLFVMVMVLLLYICSTSASLHIRQNGLGTNAKKIDWNGQNFLTSYFFPPQKRKTCKSILITIMTPKQFSNNTDESANEKIPTSNVGGTGQHQGRGHRHSKSRKWSLTPSIFFISTITVIVIFTIITIIIRMAISIIIYVTFTGKWNNDFVIGHDLYKDILPRSTPWRYWPYSTKFVRVSILHSVL